MINLTRSRWFMTSPPVNYKRHRFPSQIIAHAVWLYFRFPLSLPFGRGDDARAWDRRFL